MKKKILLLLLVFSCFYFTGCEVEYNLKIRSSNFSEEIKIFENDMSLLNMPFYSGSKMTYNDYLESKIEYPPEVYLKDVVNNDYGEYFNKDAEHYIVKKIEDKNKFGVLFSYNMLSSKYTETNFIGSCFNYSSFYVNDNNNKVLVTDNSFYCWNDKLNKINIKINLPYEVVKTNADKIDGDNYIWIFDKDNYDEKSIFIEYTNSLNTKNSVKSGLKSFVNTNFLPIFSMIVLGIAGVILFVIKKNQNKVNKI